jgi:class 3 adenylate cyclase
MFVFNNTYNVFKERYYLIVLLFFVWTIPTLHGQTETNTDAYKSKADTLYSKSIKHLRSGEYDLALNFAEESLTVLSATENYKGIGDIHNQIATIHFYKSEFRQALAAFQNSKASYEKADFKNGIATSTNNIGAIYYSMGNYSKAIDNYKAAIKIHEELENDMQIAGTTQNIGNIYYVLNDYVNAKIYYDKAEKSHEKANNLQALALVKSSLGRIHLKEENYGTALTYFNTSLKLAKESNNKQVQSEVLFNIGTLYQNKHNEAKSIQYFEESVAIAAEIGNNLQKSTSLVALGNVYLTSNKKSAAIKNCNAGFLLAEQLNVISIQEDACKCLYEAYKATNNPAKALLYNEKMYVFRDSLNIKQTSDKILNMKYEKEMLLDSIANVEKQRMAELAHQKVVQKKEKQRNIFIIAGLFAFIIAIGIFGRLRLVKQSKSRLQIEKDRSEHLLHNILPEEVADELKEKGYVNAQDFDTASILFTDFKSFTETASLLSPQELVEEINVYFKAFDEVIERYQIEKIKTIGDAYMAAGGLPKPDKNAVKNTILAAIDMQLFVAKRKLEKKAAFDMRVGIHVGPIVAGIVGVKKFQYDIWGDTVNIASRMESNGAVGKVNISNDTYQLIKDEADFIFEYRGKIDVKGKGELDMYFVDKAQKYTPVQAPARTNPEKNLEKVS